MSLRLSGHGGGCCGINHIHNFDVTITEENIRQALAMVGSVNMLVEVVVTNDQLRANPTLGASLNANGFVLVNRFTNPNSGNNCNVFHRVSARAQRSLVDRLPPSVVPNENAQKRSLYEKAKAFFQK